jgi:sulfate adenylyltransferase large subunit
MGVASGAAPDFDDFVHQVVSKELLRFFTAGNVDDGKSTLIGRLLYDSQAIYEDQLVNMRRPGFPAGESAIDFAFLTDGLRAEREQGITIDVAYRFFSTPKRQFIIADTPGHEQYTRNMATGASTASLAIILIDGRNGVLLQSRRHAFIASLLGVSHMVVAVNKMDLVDFSERRFDEIRTDFSKFAAPLQIKDTCFIPISALHGDNVVHRSERMPWFDGPTLLGYLESVHIASDRNLAEMRFPVQYVIRTNDGFRGYAGPLVSGILQTGDEVMVLPSRIVTRIQSMHTYEEELERALPPIALTVTLAEELDVGRGAMLVHPVHAPRVSRVVDARLVWMTERPLDNNASYLVKHTTQIVGARVRDVRYRMNVNTLEKEPSNQLALNDIGAVTLVCHKSLFYDAYKRNPATGSLILIDPITNETAAVGMITGIQTGEVLATTMGTRTGPVKEQERSARCGHKPAIICVRDNSPLVQRLERLLFDRGCFVHTVEEVGEPAEILRLVKILNAAGLITIWSTPESSRDQVEAAAQLAGIESFIAVEEADARRGEEEAARSVCVGLEDQGVIPPATATD